MSAEFAGAGAKVGMEVWRIEKMVPTPVPSKMHGHFYEGDAYICLKTSQKPKSSTLIHDIFFWLGKEVSQDESGVAAYKTVELDESLGGGPTQHRETQGNESQLFLQSFNSVQYLKGGVASGFTHVERDEYETRLLHLKGAKMVRVTVVPLSAASLNAGDVFVLDNGLSIIQWNGSEANRKEKAKALDVCVGIKDEERHGKATITACEQGSEPEEFWKALGGKGTVAAAVPDSAPAALKKGELKLFKVSDASGTMVKSEVATGTLEQKMLTTEEVYILDNVAEVYVWVGKKASADERKKGMEYGQKYTEEGGRPKHTKLSKVMEGTEPTTFKANFVSWEEEDALMPTDFSSMMTPRGTSNVALTPRGRSSAELAATMVEHAAAGDKSKTADIGTNGKVEVWRIEGFDKVPVDESLEGQFYAGDSYIVQYTYEVHGKEKYIIYFWLGAKSSADEFGAAAILATKMDDELGGAATQVRVAMGKEPSHFVEIFQGKLVIHEGGKASGFKNRAEADSYDTDGTSLYHVRGTSAANTRAVQIEEKAEHLNSGDCFVLLTPGKMYVWLGKLANETEHATAVAVADELKASRTTEEVKEGSEPDAFWSALGGKAEYTTAKWLPPASREPMLFSCSNSTGTIVIEPIFNFSQADLLEEDVYVLDEFVTIFVWVGSQANDAEKAAAENTAAAYIQANKMDPATPVITVKSGAEPEMFHANFLGWDDSKKKSFVDPYEAKLAAIKAANPAPEPIKPKLTPRSSSLSQGKLPPPSPAKAASWVKEPEPEPVEVADPAPVVPKLPIKPADGSYTLNYEELKKPADQLPNGLDLTKKEQYLSDAEFLQVLGSPRATFAALKPWKQAQVKRAAGLF